MAAIKVSKHLHIDRVWTKDITFTYEGEEYYVHLLWDEREGYKMWWFKDENHAEYNLEPEWVPTYQPSEGDDGQYNLAIQLDALCIDKGEGLIVKHTNNRLNTTELESL
jgi:hypothetical protein